MRLGQPLSRAGRLVGSFGLAPSRSCSSAVPTEQPATDASGVLKRARVDKARAGTPHKPPQNMRRPPYYRSTYVNHAPQRYKHNMLRQEVAPRGDGGPRGYQHVATGPRLHDYYEVARIVKSLPTISEKIDFVNPYERDWSRFEKRWHREWLSKLNKPRGAWAIPLIPRYFDTQAFYQHITKTRVVDDRAKFDEIYKSIVLPTASFENRVLESLRVMLQEESTETEKERVSRFLRAMLDDAQMSLAHNREELRHQRVTHTARCETFWIRGGFLNRLYASRDGWLPPNYFKIHTHIPNISRYPGDDFRRLGELSFTMRDEHVAHVRSTERLKLLFPTSDKKRMEAPLSKKGLGSVYSPKVYNLRPDEDILWQCPGYEPDSGETHMFGRLALKEVCDMRDQCVEWGIDASTDDGEAELAETRRDMYTSTAISSLFTWLNGQAHCLGHTQYTDIEEPLVSQLVLSDGKEFFFAIGQLNTIAINIDVPGELAALCSESHNESFLEFINRNTNVCFIDGPHSLYDTFDKDTGTFYHTSKVPREEGGTKVNVTKEGLNPHVLSRILQMLVR